MADIRYIIRRVRDTSKRRKCPKQFGRISTVPKEWIGQKVLIVPINEYECQQVRLMDRCTKLIYKVLSKHKVEEHMPLGGLRWR